MNQFLIRRIATQIIEYAVRVSTTDPDAVGPFDPSNPPPTIAPIVEPGCEAIPYEGDTTILARRPTPTSELEWGGTAPVWIERGDIPAQRAHKAAAISSSCADVILAGFASSALGEPHTYPAKLNDQANLTGSVVRSMYPNIGPEWRTPFWCVDMAGAWEFRLHTATQIQQVGDDAVAARLHCMGINEALQAQIAVAVTPSEIAAINWPEKD